MQPCKPGIIEKYFIPLHSFTGAPAAPLDECLIFPYILLQWYRVFTL